jgi:translocation and assembly module TamB
MKPAARRALRVAIGLAIALVVALVVRAWVVPAVIARELRANLHGPAKFDGWWLGWSSAGVTGLAVCEGPDGDSPEWLTADRVATDLSVGGLLRGRLAPERIELRGPKIALRFDEKGELLTKGPFEGGGATTAPPDVLIEDGQVTIDQRGRPPLTVRGISGGLRREEDVEDLELDGHDPDWGTWTVRGRFDAAFKTGSVRLASGPGFVANPDRVARMPFVPPEVWQHIVPAGPVDVAVAVSLTEGAPKPLHVRTEVTFRGAAAGLPGLGIDAEGTTGRITVDDGLVRLAGHSPGRSPPRGLSTSARTSRGLTSN